MEPTFSIIVPTYNNTQVLMKCLGSLSHQTIDGVSFEVIVVNDGDEDELPSKLLPFASRLNLRYYRQAHRGPAAARNLGIKNSRGEIILFLDDDSLPSADWLSATQHAWERHHDVAGIGGFTASERGDSLICKVNTDIFNWYLRANSPGQKSTFLSTHNAGYQAAVLRQIGQFDEGFLGASGEDRDLSLKIARMGGTLRLDERILVYHDRDLKLKKFIRKYYGYGKASRAIYSRYPDVKRLSGRSYLRLLFSTLHGDKTQGERVLAIFLAMLSQLATLAGYVVDRFSGFKRSC
jgi:glycosyltransferase involved in cell wall biosynthesis